MENAEAFNNLLVSVAFWLKTKEKLIYKFYLQQSQRSIEYEMFKDSIKKKDLTQTETGETENPESTFNTLDYKLSYDDFKLGRFNV